jgi:F-type H+-transporting ATPase subunit b
MKRLALCALACGMTLALAQETAPAKAEHGQAGEKSGGGEEGLEVWKWANFAILAGALGYGIAKKGGPFFQSRSQEIRKGIAEAEELRKNAELKAADVDRRLANLGIEVEQLRVSARSEQAAATERLRQETAAELTRIQEHATREIDSAAKAARVELKRYAARLAIDLAEQKLRARMNAESQSALVDNFVRNLDRPA